MCKKWIIKVMIKIVNNSSCQVKTYLKTYNVIAGKAIFPHHIRVNSIFTYRKFLPLGGGKQPHETHISHPTSFLWSETVLIPTLVFGNQWIISWFLEIKITWTEVYDSVIVDNLKGVELNVLRWNPVRANTTLSQGEVSYEALRKVLA